MRDLFAPQHLLLIFIFLIVIVTPVFLLVKVIYKYGKNKGRLEELEKRVKNN